MRVVLMQTTQVMSHYFNDQLKAGLERDELVRKKEMSPEEAEKEEEEWVEVSIVCFESLRGIDGICCCWQTL
jgi:hypothetical protein